MSDPEALETTDDVQARVRRAELECDCFEAAWKRGQRPRIEDHLAAVPESERAVLLRDLLALEVDYRRLAGERIASEELQSRFPTLEPAWIGSLLNEIAKPGHSPASEMTGPDAGVSKHADTKSAPSTPRLQLPGAAGASPGLGDDLQTVLRRRLLSISLVLFVIYAYFLSGVLRNFDVFLEFWFYTPPYFLALIASGVLGLVLWRKRPLPVSRLRGIELILFGAVLVQLAAELSTDLFLTPPFAGVTEWANTSEKDNYFLWIYGHYATLPFSLLIISYAALIPSDVRRCTVVVGVMAATPLVISTVAGIWIANSPSTFFYQHVRPMGICLGITVAIAAYGTHRIEILRKEIVQARKLGQYQLKQLLGKGGMGEVYLAEHVLLKQPCAIKLIRPERAGDSATLRRFEREVKTTARLKHWNTVRIFDYGHTADGIFYYVMEYLPGLTLEQLVKQHGPQSPARCVHLIRQACMALREAHALGLIHRNIKPANIMLCEQGGVHDVVKLLDFGLVKAVGLDGQEETLTQEGAITGTPAYMSPEQASGQDHLDGRTDICSLGALAYFLLTGQPPFSRDKAIQTIVAHIHEPVRPLTDLRAEIPADLQAVVLRCLEKDPARRFADASRLDDAFAGCSCAEK